LAKVCRKLNVPTPPRGFWARKAAGHEVQSTPLPALKAGEAGEYKVRKWAYADPPAPTAEELAFRARPEFQPQPIEIPFRLEVAPTLERPHRLVAVAKKGLAKSTSDHNGLRWTGVPE